MNNEVLKVNEKFTQVARSLNAGIAEVFSDGAAKEGFEKAYLVAQAIETLKGLLTPEYMKPIMQLQGNKLGFRTDKDEEGGYPEQIVKQCLIEAVLTGVQPVGNQFNIITGVCYITKEGFGYLLKSYPGLWYEIIPQLPRINNDKSGAAVIMGVEWKIKGTEGAILTKSLDIPVRMNARMGTDAVIGKATRKARAWLYNTITGSEIADGDISDLQDAKRLGAAELIANRSTALGKEAEDAIRKASEKKNGNGEQK